MKNFKRIIILILAFTLIASIMTGCSGDDQTTNDGSTSTTEGTYENTTPGNGTSTDPNTINNNGTNDDQINDNGTNNNGNTGIGNDIGNAVDDIGNGLGNAIDDITGDENTTTNDNNQR